MIDHSRVNKTCLLCQHQEYVPENRNPKQWLVLSLFFLPPPQTEALVHLLRNLTGVESAYKWAGCQSPLSNKVANRNLQNEGVAIMALYSFKSLVYLTLRNLKTLRTFFNCTF